MPGELDDDDGFENFEADERVEEDSNPALLQRLASRILNAQTPREVSFRDKDEGHFVEMRPKPVCAHCRSEWHIPNKCPKLL